MVMKKNSINKKQKQETKESVPVIYGSTIVEQKISSAKISYTAGGRPQPEVKAYDPDPQKAVQAALAATEDMWKEIEKRKLDKSNK